MAITVNKRPYNSGKTNREDNVSINGTTTLVASGADLGSSTTRWQIRRTINQETVFDFTINSEGSLQGTEFESFFDSDGASVRIKLDRQYNYQARTLPDGGSWGEWADVDLSGALRIFGPRHRDSYTTTRTGNGLAVTSNNDKFTIRNTSNGISVTPNYDNYRTARTLRIPYKKSTSGQ